ncbi:MAG: transglycosylase domain-containing protein [Cyclobacteriaceae bacterium]|nr:transglycosylase domain-containing protein [Cyclobacteriaceae bacterium]
MSKVIKILWVLFFALLIGLPLFFYSVKINFLNLYGDLPSIKSLENPKSDVSSELYSIDGQSLGKYFRENRSLVDYDEISPNVINALIATEDYRFERHSGLDLRGLMRVGVFTLLLRQDSKGGGSTITQQLAKNLFKTRSTSKGHLSGVPGLGMVIVKVKEWLVAIYLETNYTKREIITMYLNTVDFGSNSFGIKVAAQTFFNKEPSDLNLQEAATLVGLLKAPTRYSPVSNPENSTYRRNTVLAQMSKYGFISPQVQDSIANEEMVVQFKVENHNQGLATYFRSVIRSFLISWTRENGYDLFEDGLKIYTTIDSRMQQYAEDAVAAHMAKLQKIFDDHWKGRNPWIDADGAELKGFIESVSKSSEHYRRYRDKYGQGHDSIDILMNTPKKMRLFSWDGEVDSLISPMDSIRYYKRFLHTGFMAMDPNNGHIKAWVGGINHKYFKYDHVKQGKRQPGSTFKPIVYATAIESGYSPCYEVRDVPVTFQVVGDPPTWTPKNASGQFSEEMLTIRQAMARSVNSVTAFLMQKVSPQAVVNMAQRLGIKSPLEAVPALSLGSSDVSIYELTGAYSTFVNEGTWTEPFFITRIEDKNGVVLQEFVPNTIEALNEETAYLMLHMLKGATEERGGTALGLSPELRMDNEIGAKTGTTSNYSDGWFVGVTKDLVAGVWVGGDNRSIRFRNMALGQGARTAMPIWEQFMLKVYKDEALGYEKGPFKKPNRRLSVEIDCDKVKGLDFLYDQDDEMLNLDSLREERRDIRRDEIM